MRFEQRLPNDLFTITEGFRPFRKWIKALAVESTYNRCWLVDGLRKVKCDVRLANPVRMQEIDFTDIPPIDKAMFKKMVIRMPEKKAALSLRLDPRVIEIPPVSPRQLDRMSY